MASIMLPIVGRIQSGAVCGSLHSMDTIRPRTWLVRAPSSLPHKCGRHVPSLFHPGRLVVRSHLGQLPDAASAASHAACSVIPSALDHLAAKITVILLTLADVSDSVSDVVSDAVTSTASDAASSLAAASTSAADAVNSTVNSAVNTAATVTQTKTDDGGVFGWLALGFEGFLKVLDTNLEKFNVPYSYGFAIILLTFIVKAATYPLSKRQVESTMATQALQPRVREIQTKFKSDPEKMQMEVAKLYREAGVNPLAGCLPTLATIPIWIGLYKALSNVANEGLLTEGFFWIPSLAGPTTLAQQEAGGGLSWLFPLQNGAPPIGWGEAAAYLVLPVLLVLSQWLSQKIISPQQSEDPSQKQAQAILAALPFLIGWFSLNVPSGLALYWLTNNILTTAQQLWLRSQVKPAMATGGITSSSSSVMAPPSSQQEAARPTGKDLGSRRRRTEFDADVIDVTPSSVTTTTTTEKGGKKKGDKFKEIKAREQARKKGKSSQGDKFKQLKEAEQSSKQGHEVSVTTQVQEPTVSQDNSSVQHATKSNASE